MWTYAWKWRTIGRPDNERMEYARWLGRTGGNWALGLLRGALREEKRHVRQAAVEALGLLGGDNAMHAIATVLNDREPSVRIAAVRIMGETGRPDALRYLRTCMSDLDAAVRAETARAAGNLRDPRAVNMLDRLLRDPDFEVRLNSVEALGAIGDEFAVRSLVRGLLDHERKVQDAARDLLCLLNHPGAIHALQPVLKHRDSSVRSQAIIVLKRLHDARAIEPLLEALRDIDYVVRVEAARALTVYDDPRVHEALRVASNDSHPAVRNAAAEALRSQGRPATPTALPSRASAPAPSMPSRPSGSGEFENDVFESDPGLKERNDRPPNRLPGRVAPPLASTMPIPTPGFDALTASTDSLPSIKPGMPRESSSPDDRLPISGPSNPFTPAFTPGSREQVASEATLTQVGRGRVIDMTPLPGDGTPERRKGWERALKMQMILRRYRKAEGPARAAARAEVEEAASAEAIEPILLFLKDGPPEQWLVDLLAAVVDREPKRILDQELDILQSLTVFNAAQGPNAQALGAGSMPTIDIEGLNCSRVRELARRELVQRGKAQ